MSDPTAVVSKELATKLAKVILDHNENGYSLQGACQHNNMGYEELIDTIKDYELKITLPHDGIVLVEKKNDS